MHPHQVRLRAKNVTGIRWTCPDCAVVYEIYLNTDYSYVRGDCPSCADGTGKSSFTVLRQWLETFKALRDRPVDIQLLGPIEETVYTRDV